MQSEIKRRGSGSPFAKEVTHGTTSWRIRIHFRQNPVQWARKLNAATEHSSGERHCRYFCVTRHLVELGVLAIVGHLEVPG
jgi:hypothetical protein